MYKLSWLTSRLFYSLSHNVPLPTVIQKASSFSDLVPHATTIFHQNRQYLPLFLRKLRLITPSNIEPQGLQFVRKVNYRVGECSSELNLTLPELIQTLLFRCQVNRVLRNTQGFGFEYRAALIATSHISEGKLSLTKAVTLYSLLSQTNSVSLSFLGKFTGFLKQQLQKDSSDVPLTAIVTILSVYQSKPNHNILEEVMVGLCARYLIENLQSKCQGQEMEVIVQLLRFIVGTDVRGSYMVNNRDKNQLIGRVCTFLTKIKETKTSSKNLGQDTQNNRLGLSENQFIKLTLTIANQMGSFDTNHETIHQLHSCLENLQQILALPLQNSQLIINAHTAVAQASKQSAAQSIINQLHALLSTFKEDEQYSLTQLIKSLYHKTPPSFKYLFVKIIPQLISRDLLNNKINWWSIAITYHHNFKHLDEVISSVEAILKNGEPTSDDFLSLFLLNSQNTQKISNFMGKDSVEVLTSLHRQILRFQYFETTSQLLSKVLGNRVVLFETVADIIESKSARDETKNQLLCVIFHLLCSQTLPSSLSAQRLYQVAGSIDQHCKHAFILHLFPNQTPANIKQIVYSKMLLSSAEHFARKYKVLCDMVSHPNFQYLLWDLFRQCYLRLPLQQRRQCFDLLTATLKPAIEREEQRRVVIAVTIAKYLSAGDIIADRASLLKLFRQIMEMALTAKEGSNNFHYECFEQLVRHGLASGLLEMDQLERVVKMGQSSRKELYDRCTLMLLFGAVKKSTQKWTVADQWWNSLLSRQAQYLRNALRNKKIRIERRNQQKAAYQRGIITAGVEYVSVLLMWQIAQTQYLLPDIIKLIETCQEVEDFTLMALSWRNRNKNNQFSSLTDAIRSKIAAFDKQGRLEPQFKKILEKRAYVQDDRHK